MQNKPYEFLQWEVTTPPQPPEPPTPTVSLTDFVPKAKAGTAKAEYPVGTEIPDTWDGRDNPLIVAQYIDETNKSTYGGFTGAICIRKYVDPVDFGVDDASTNGAASYFSSTYIDKCSREFMSSGALTQGVIPNASGSGTTCYWFIMSGIEVGSTYNAGEGFMWDYWKQQTGLSAASNAANAGRIRRDRTGEAQDWWLRSAGGMGPLCDVAMDGSVSNRSTSMFEGGLLAACFIGNKSGGFDLPIG